MKINHKLFKEYDKTAHVSYSQLWSFSNCPTRWYLDKIERLQRNYDETLVSKRTLGKLAHIVMENLVFYFTTTEGMLGINELPDLETKISIVIEKADKDFEDYLAEQLDRLAVIEEEIAMIHDLWGTAKSIAIRTAEEINLFKGRWKTIRIKNENAIEHGFDVPFIQRRRLVGFIDWIAEDTWEGGVYVIDFKFKSQLSPIEDYELEWQTSLYRAYLKATHKIDTTGNMIIQVKAKEFKRPSVNKDGSMSKAQIYCTWDHYKQCLIEEGLNPEDYLEMRDKLASTEVVRITRMNKTLHELKAVVENAKEIAKATRYNKSVVIYKNMTPMNCRGCQYEEICIEDLKTGDPSGIIESNYTVREVK